ncbi:hypothetical protein Peur_035634 [Populus x canadensis]
MYPFTAMEEGNSACMITTSDLAIVVGLSATGAFNLLLNDDDDDDDDDGILNRNSSVSCYKLLITFQVL